MARKIPILPKTTFTFDGRAAAGASQTVVLAERVDTSWFATGVLEVKLHAKNPPPWTSTTATAEVRVYSMRFADEDPAQLFVEPSARATIVVTNADTAPKFYLMALTAPLGGQVRVVLVWIQGTVGSGANGDQISLGVDLVGRE